MPMRLEAGLILALALTQPAVADPAACPVLIAALEGATGLDLSARPAPDVAGWCVLDSVRSTGAVRVSAEALRLRGETAGDALVALEVEGSGLRVAPALNNRDMPDWLRDLLRLQTAEFRVSIRRDDAEDALVLDKGQLSLSGGGELLVKAEVTGAELSAASLLTGRVTKLYLEWQNDGRTLRPILEAWGEQLDPGATGTEAVLAARGKLESIVAAMPEGSLLDGMPEGVAGFIAALPQGRGRLLLMAGSDKGIGAAEIGLLALSKDPTGSNALARFFAGTRVSVAWTAGLNP
jgi:hypothetical protein